MAYESVDAGSLQFGSEYGYALVYVDYSMQQIKVSITGVLGASYNVYIDNKTYTITSYGDIFHSYKSLPTTVIVEASYDGLSDIYGCEVPEQNTAPTTPSSITVPSSIKGGSTITISWGAATDADGNLSRYVVQRSANGGSWTQIYSGSALSTTNTVAAGTNTVAYRVKAVDAEGLSSEYKTSNTITVINNTAPTAPSSITVPSQIYAGDTVPVSWGAATDTDGNLSGYILERSIDGGAWSQIYSGTATAYTDTTPDGATTLAYRVKATDSDGAESGYTTSGTVTVVYSNMYIGMGGQWRRAKAVYMGSRKAKPIVTIT